MTQEPKGTGTQDDPWRLTTPPGKAEAKAISRMRRS